MRGSPFLLSRDVDSWPFLALAKAGNAAGGESGGTAPSRVALLRVGVLGAILIVVVVLILLGRI